MSKTCWMIFVREEHIIRQFPTVIGSLNAILDTDHGKTIQLTYRFVYIL